VRSKVLWLLGVFIWGATLSLAVAATNGGDDDNDPRIRQGFAISPVPLNLNGRNRALVGLGSYLVNAVGACNDCHTNPPFAHDGNPFTGAVEQANVTHFLAGGRMGGPRSVRRGLC
jgi:hypothetical protein